MVYASGFDESGTLEHPEMCAKILNILRICHAHGHESLIICSRISQCNDRQIADIFCRLLFDTSSSDVALVFSHVIFSLPSLECSSGVLTTFQQVFARYISYYI